MAKTGRWGGGGGGRKLFGEYILRLTRPIAEVANEWEML